ncbi:MAG: branched-chain amino acid ABC transporter ATP-binding protein/permease [Proteobacteria bacterium]|nr:branched-chain amino acid ABC transporter ATP-binding protein/permease [Pseudomonadota bacterium]
MRLRTTLPLLVLAVAYAVISFFVTNSYYQLMMTLVLVWASFGLAWNLFSGYTGLISFGHAVFFGLGAYFTALGQIYFDFTPWLLIPVAALVGGAAGLLIGALTFRLRSHYFALAMLAYPLAILNVFMWLGYQELTIPMKHKGAVLYMQFTDGRMYTLIAIVMTVAIVILSQAVERSRFGMALIAIKQNEAAAEAAGINTLVWKLRAITLSGAITGAIGAFYVMVLLVVTPESVFGMLVSAQALTVTMFGGVGTVWGPLIGAAILIPTSQILQAKLGAQFPGIEGVIYGLAIIVVILSAPEGIFWRVRDKLRKRSGTTAVAEAVAIDVPTAGDAAPAASVSQSGGQIILSVRNLSKSFGGLKAVQNVSFDVQRGSILGIIGPNGAGKTTLFNLLNGFQHPDAGEVMLDGHSVFGVTPHRLCEAGVGRTFQVMRPFPRLTVAENVVIGAYVRAANDAEAREHAANAIARAGLTNVAHRVASELTTKELRLMELARALAGAPRLLLLDETLAGLGANEAAEVVTVLRALAKQGITIVIIEHTMHTMVRLVDRFVVLDHGAVLVEDTPQAITRDSRVIEAYLGTKWSAHA